MSILPILLAGLLALIHDAVVPAAPPGAELGAHTDSARAELRIGRYWHAARAFRAAGAASGPPSSVLLLARAEAGWGNWRGAGELLEGAEWLAEEDEGSGLLLLGRALEARGDWAGAAGAYERYLLAAPAAAGRGRVALARRARALDRSGDPGGALAALDAIGEGSVVSWAALELARRAAEEGDTTRVADLLARVDTDEAARRAWRLEADARLAAGDTAGGAEALRTAIAAHSERSRASETAELGLLTLALGDTAEAGRLLLASFEDARGDVRDRAALALFEISPDRPLEVLLDLARTLDRAGDGRESLDAYDRAARLAAADGGALPGWARVGRARLMATVRGRQDGALAEFRAIRETATEERVGARNLEVWAQMRRRQGRSDHVATLRSWLLEEWPASDEAAVVLWSRASAAESRGDLAVALEHYLTLERSGSSHNRAGQARMRMGQIHLERRQPAAAAEVFDRYLADFPDGRRWDEAAYWSARAHLDNGDTAASSARVQLIERRDPFSYYAVIGEQLLGRPYEVVLPEGEAPVEPEWLTRGLEGIELLDAAGLDEAVEAEVDALRRRARPSKVVTLRLAQALIESGRTLAGIQIGWQMVDDGHPWDRRLARTVFPFPYRELISREAEEWGVDPILVAALIRQESAFQAEIVSFAGAVGLMQVMPTTGLGLARRHGVVGFNAASLRVADVNVHLGAAYFVEMHRRFSGDLPLVLTAYNAGPTRARRWARLPEASDPIRFTEVIPIEETRGYVKGVRRNVALYRALYGDGR